MSIKHQTKFHGGIRVNGGITFQPTERMDMPEPIESTTVYESDGDIILRTKDKEISVNSLIKRLEALETAFMEEKLLGKEDE